MRKDVRIGLSIGGVLLAVLIVYLLVPKDSGTGKSPLVAQNGTTATGQGGPADAGAAGGASETGTTSNTDNSTAGGANPADTSAGAQTGESHGTSGVPATSPDGASAGTGAAGQADANKGGFDWASILEKGVMPESLVATNPPANNANDPFADANKRNNNTRAIDPAPPIEWPTTGGQPTGGTTSGTGSTGTTTGGTTGSGPAARIGLTDHTVQPHETFSTIALAAYGDPRFYKAIQKANPGIDERRLRPGMVIKMPDSAAIKAQSAPAAVTPAAAKPVDPSREYVVQPNDSLQKIAIKLYGKATKDTSIYEANKDKIGSDPHRIKVGMVLKLPEAPTAGPTAALAR